MWNTRKTQLPPVPEFQQQFRKAQIWKTRAAFWTEHFTCRTMYLITPSLNTTQNITRPRTDSRKKRAIRKKNKLKMNSLLTSAVSVPGMAGDWLQQELV